MNGVPLAGPARVALSNAARYRHAFLLCVLSLIVTALIKSYFMAYAIDDSFIGYTNAVHLAQGEGFTFNLSDRLLTTSAPLMVLIYAAFLRICHVDVVLQGQVWSAVSLLVIAVFSYLTALNYTTARGAFVAAFVFTTGATDTINRPGYSWP